MSAGELQRLFEIGELQDADLVWTQGMSEWKPAVDVQSHFASVAAPMSMDAGIDLSDPMAEPAPKRTYDVGEPLGIERKYAPAESHEYANILLRFVAMIIDGFIVGALQLVVLIPTMIVVATMFATTSDLGQPVATSIGQLIWYGACAFTVVIQWYYFAKQESGIKMATIGKRAVGIKVLDTDGYPVSLGRATGRHFAKIISGMFCGIGFLFPLFTAKNQALHDMIAGCIIVKAK